MSKNQRNNGSGCLAFVGLLLAMLLFTWVCWMANTFDTWFDARLDQIERRLDMPANGGIERSMDFPPKKHDW